MVDIQFFNKMTGKMDVEKVYGDKMVEWLYQSNTGKALSEVLVKPWLSNFYGLLQNTSWSKGKIKPFIKDFNIPLDDFLPEEGRDQSDPYSSFNQFFIRRFKPGKRHFPSESNLMGAPAEARYYAYESIQDDELIPVKGKFLNSPLLLANTKWENIFKDGPCLLARLCPVDYHRYHYPDNGTVLDHYPVHGKLHSVNPLALKEKADIFATNERVVTILETENFGKLAYVEVGAIMVGKIIQSGSLTNFSRGEEKGYFLFGGSTVIVLGERGKWKPDDLMIQNTKKKIETYAHLGANIAHKI